MAPIVIPKNAREEIRVSLDEFQGHALVNLRVWFLADDGEMRPSKKGLAFKTALLPDVLEALGVLVRQTEPEGTS